MSVPGPDGRIVIRHRRGAREARIDDDELGLVMRLGLGHPFEAAGMRFGGIAAHDQDHIGILDVDPVIRHRSTAKRRGKTCHRRAVSHTSLVVECQHAETSAPSSPSSSRLRCSPPMRPACRCVIQRLTVRPSGVLATKFASRSCFISLAMRSSASSHGMRCHRSEPARDTRGSSDGSRCGRSRSGRRLSGTACRD